MTYDEERAQDVKVILEKFKEGLAENSLEYLIEQAWMFGWSAGFAYQGTVDQAVQQDHPDRGEIEKRWAEKVERLPTWKTYRDASTGHYVNPEYAKANPDTTVSETHRRYPGVPPSRGEQC
jgi:hypothetical protein